MRTLRRAALAVLGAVFAAALLADYIAPAPYDRQFRDAPSAPPGERFPLGADDLGRDRLSRLLHGTRISLTLAPAAALLATSLAALFGILAGWRGGWLERAILAAADVLQSLPLLFLLLAVRAALPLNVAPAMSLAITFALLGSLGWAQPVRVVRAAARSLRESDFLLHARACGQPAGRVLGLHLASNLRPVLAAQFWLAVPAFILSEANLSVLGLGVAEPLPSWGTLIGEMTNLGALTRNPWVAAPAALLVLVVCCFHLAIDKREISA